MPPPYLQYFYAIQRAARAKPQPEPRKIGAAIIDPQAFERAWADAMPADSFQSNPTQAMKG